LWIDEMTVRRILGSGLIAALIVVLGLAWQDWQQRQSLHLPTIDHILVDKAARRMTVFSGGHAIQTFAGIQLGDVPIGQKHFEGDERTPEGQYRIDFRNPESSYHLSLRISYPDAAASAFAAAKGLSPGGEIYIHGQPNWLPLGRLMGDWTDGCVALSNPQIEAVWKAVAVGTTVEIRP